MFKLTRPEPKEAQVLKAVLRAFELHPDIAFVRRMNSGALPTAKGGFVRFGFAGCPDVWAQSKSGRLIVCEVKSLSGVIRKEQDAFLRLVNENGGFGFVARSVNDVINALAKIRGDKT